MSRSATMTVGDASAGIRVDYIQRRRTLRLSAFHHAGPAMPPVDLPLADLGRLGIAVGDLRASRYLLFGGSYSQRRGGTGDLIGAFGEEERAREAFVELRRRGDSDWAELTAVDACGGIRRLAWFGPARASDERRSGAGAAGPPRKPVTEQGQHRGLPRFVRHLAVRLLVAGALSAAAVGIAHAALNPGPGHSVSAPTGRSATSGAAATLVGHVAVSVEDLVYEPGESIAHEQSADWRAVEVLDGALTVVDGDGSRHPYGPGERYVAGWAPYSEVNDETSATHVRVTHLGRAQ